MSHHENTLRKALIIHGITRRYYEPGRQDRSLKRIWRLHVNPYYPMSLDTYYRLLRVAERWLEARKKPYKRNDCM